MAASKPSMLVNTSPPVAVRGALNYSGLNSKPYSFSIKDFNITGKISARDFQVKLTDIDYKGDGYFLYNNQRIEKSSSLTIPLSNISKLKFMPGSEAASKGYQDNSAYASFKFSLSSNKGLSFGNSEDFNINISGVNKAFIKDNPDASYERVLFKADFQTNSAINPAINKIQITGYPKGSLKFLDAKGAWINYGAKGTPKSLSLDDINNGKLKLVNSTSAEIKFNLLVGSKVVDKGKLILSVGDSKAVISGDSNVLVQDDGTAAGKLGITDRDPYDKPSFKAGLIQGKYGELNLSADGTWSYAVNKDSSDYKSLLIGHSVNEKVSVYSSDLKSMIEINVVIQGQAQPSDGTPSVPPSDGGVSAEPPLVPLATPPSDGTPSGPPSDGGVSAEPPLVPPVTPPSDGTPSEPVDPVTDGSLTTGGLTFQVLGSFDALQEDVSTDVNQGELVSSLLTSSSIANLGIAITSLGSGVEGTWEYKLAGSTNWVSIPSLDAVAKEAFLLKGTDSIRFSPAANANGQTSLSFSAWDGSDNLSSGTKTTINTVGGSSAFSFASGTVTLQIISVNDAPVITRFSIGFESFENILSKPYTLFDATQPFVTDVEQNFTGGSLEVSSSLRSSEDVISVISNKSFNSKVLSFANSQVSYDGKVIATLIESSPNLNSIKFSLTSNANNENVGYLIRSISYQNILDNPTLKRTFTTTLIDSDGAKVVNTTEVIVNPQNDAPVIVSAADMGSIQEDLPESSNLGTRIKDIFQMTDPDYGSAAVPDSAKGVAIFSLGAGGLWEYKLSGSSTWVSVSNLTESRALLLGADDSIRFKPNVNFDGDSGITFFAWDRSSGTAGAYVDVSGTKRGGATAFSQNSLSSTIDLTPQNDAPSLVTTSAFTSINEDDQSSAGTAVKNLINFSDVDFASSIVPDANKGIAITGIGAHGFFEYSIDNGQNWVKIENISSSNALLLSGDNLIRFRPDENYNGSSELKFYAWDKSSFNNGDFVDLSNLTSRGGITPFGLDEKTSTIVINSVNDAPVITGFPYAIQTYDFDVITPQRIFENKYIFNISDVDDSNFSTGILRIFMPESFDSHKFSISDHDGITYNSNTGEVLLNNHKIGVLESDPATSEGIGFQVNLTSEASPDAIKSLLAAITYQNTDPMSIASNISLSFLDHQGGDWFSQNVYFFNIKTIFYPTEFHITSNQIQADSGWDRIPLSSDINNPNIIVTDRDGDAYFNNVKIELIDANSQYSVQLGDDLLANIKAVYNSYDQLYEPSMMPGNYISSFGWSDETKSFSMSGDISLEGLNIVLNSAYVSHTNLVDGADTQSSSDFKVRITTTGLQGDVSSADILIDFPPDHII